MDTEHAAGDQPSPMYKQIAWKLEAQIDRGELAPGSQLPDELALARRFDVDVRTVREAMASMEQDGLIRRGPDGGLAVSDPERGAAVMIGRSRLPLIGVFARNLDETWPGLIHTICGEAEAQGFSVVLGHSTTRRQTARALKHFLEMGVQGIMVYSNVRDMDAVLTAALREGIPVVSMPVNYGVSGLDCVVMDEVAAVRCAVEHLVSVGRQRIGYLQQRGEHFELFGGPERLQGFRQTCQELRVRDYDAWTITVSSVVLTDEDWALLSERLSHPDCPEAFVCYNDTLAIVLSEAVHRLGREVGVDVAVVGIDDSPPARLARTPLTSVDPGNAAVARRATRLLIDRITGEESGPDRVIMAGAPRVAPRESTTLAPSVVTRRRAEHLLRHSEACFRGLFDTMSNGVVVCEHVEDGDRFVVRNVNRAAETILHVARPDVIGRPLGEIVPPFLEQNVDAIVRRVYATGECERESMVQRDGDQLAHWSECTVYKLPSGQVVIVCDDRTEERRADEERRRLQEQLRQSEKMRAVGRLAGGIAHDFNNRLAGITGCAEMLKALFPQSDALSEYADMLVRHVKEAASLTGQLAAFARRDRYRGRPVNLHDVIVRVEGRLLESVDERIRIETHLEAESPVINGDATQLANALFALCRHACDGMPQGGTLAFAAGRARLEGADCLRHSGSVPPGEFLRLVISDTGPGLDEETRKHLFEPFFADRQTGQRTGMALAAAYGIIKNHGGAIDVTDGDPEGAAFHVFLPLPEAEAADS